MMQLVKAFLIARGSADPAKSFGHGVSESLTGAGRQIDDSVLKIDKRPSRQQIFVKFIEELGGQLPVSDIPVPDVFRQVVVGSRAFTEARGESDRFFSVYSIDFQENLNAKNIWVKMLVRSGDVTRFDYRRKVLLSVPGFSDEFDFAKSVKVDRVAHYVLQSTRPKKYSVSVAEAIQKVIWKLRPFLWLRATTSSPFRKYYLLRSDELKVILPQLASIYAGMFYLGSITRYQPGQYRKMLSGNYGTHLSEYMTSQMGQFLYLLTSEWRRSDIAKPPIA